MDLSKILFRSFFLVYCQLFLSVNGYDIHDVDQLKTDLFNNTNYDTSVRPIFNQSDALQVKVLLGLTSIVSFDKVNGMLELTGYILACWQDEKLTWNSTQYGGLTKLNVDAAEIWNPEITQLNMFGESASSTFAFVQSTGIVTMVIYSELHSLCKYRYRKRYRCLISLFSARNPSTEVNLVPVTERVIVEHLEDGNGIWDLDYSYIHVYTKTIHLAIVYGINVTIDRLSVTINIVNTPDKYIDKHGALFYIHKYIPLILILFTSIAGSIIPLNSGDRISFSVTMFLALVFWVALIVDELPKNSKIDRLSMLMTMSIIQSTLSVITSVILCRLSVEEHLSIPNLLCDMVVRYKLNKKKPAKRSRLEKICIQVSVNQERSCGSADEPDSEVIGTSNTENEVTDFEITWYDVVVCFNDMVFPVHCLIVSISWSIIILLT